MKIVLSRKGFDSAAGRVASPIFPNGRMLSLPIPHPAGPQTYQDILFDGCPIAQLVSDLTNQRQRPSHRAHLDPDLRGSAIPRRPGWRPLFGQDSAAQGHLAKHRVGRGDLFLFFGWFRAVRQTHGRWGYVPNAPDLHVLFGWFEIADVVPIAEGCAMPDWAAGHPHFEESTKAAANNTLYVSSRGTDGVFSAGTFDSYRKELRLSAENRRRSRWKLPAWFSPQGRSPLSFHGNLLRWHKTEAGVLLDTVGRGQEFVLDAEQYPEAGPWARGLIDGTS
jgi:hypothetical protein